MSQKTPRKSARRLSKGKAPRRPYERPELRVIDLAAEEVLGGGCKTDSGPGPAAPLCSPGCVDQGT